MAADVRTAAELRQAGAALGASGHVLESGFNDRGSSSGAGPGS
ncbi:hypothetical protein ACTWPT_42185 [Nonomuraea sp. 3N208]